MTKKQGSNPKKKKVSKAEPEAKSLKDADFSCIPDHLLSEEKSGSETAPQVSSKSQPEVARLVQIDPNLFAGKAMMLIDAIEREIQQGHQAEWQLVADRLEKAIKNLRAKPVIDKNVRDFSPSDS